MDATTPAAFDWNRHHPDAAVTGIGRTSSPKRSTRSAYAAAETSQPCTLMTQMRWSNANNVAADTPAGSCTNSRIWPKLSAAWLILAFLGQIAFTDASQITSHSSDEAPPEVLYSSVDHNHLSPLRDQKPLRHHKLEDIRAMSDKQPSLFGGALSALVMSNSYMGDLSLPQDAPTTLPGGSLVPLTYTPLPLGSISPSSWLESELKLSAAGLAGSEYQDYRFVAQSSWLGHSTEYSDLNEGFPYWFNGLVPMAYTLNDPSLKAQVHSAADYVLSHQQSDGWIGPEITKRTFWGRYPLFLGLTNLVDANKTWEAPVVNALHKFNGLMNTMLKNNYTGYIYHDGEALDSGNFQWGRVRSQDLLISLMWLLENYPRNSSSEIVQNMFFLHQGGLNWEDWWVDGVFIKNSLYDEPQNVTDTNYHYLHGVNVAQGLKAAAVVRRLTHNDSLIATQKNGVDWTYQYHGQSSGNIIADERSDGLEPFAGAELCSAVEAIYSLSYLYSALGDGSYADLAERAAFNALPVSMTEDWWSHQYMAQTNQPYARDFNQNGGKSPFYNVNSLGNTFGLEPNYPCCTVNHPQGLPKFTMNTFMKVGDNGLIHALLAPTTATAQLQVGTVKVECKTAYPFSDSLAYTVTAPGPFDFYIRQPQWASDTSAAAVSGADSTYDASTGLRKISVQGGSTSFFLNLNPTIDTKDRANDTIAIYRGALLYSLDLGSTNSSGPPQTYNRSGLVTGMPSRSLDYVFENTTAWNYAIDRLSLKWVPPASAASAESLTSPIFAANAPPGYITAEACQIEWPLYNGATPGGPPTGSARKCIGSTTQVKLVPYGSAKIHMAEFPTIDLGKSYA